MPLAVITTVVLSFLSLMKLGKVSIVNISNADKIYHFIAYFVFTLLWLLALVKNVKHKWLVAFCCVLFGVVIEFLQLHLTNYRAAEYADAIANAAGVLLATVVFTFVFQKNKLKV